MKVCIDPGHSFKTGDGNGDTGAVNGHFYESEAALQISLKVGKLLADKNIEVHFTRVKGETDFSLRKRCDIANSYNCDCFVSIHLNSCILPEVYGIETLRLTKTSKTTERLAKYIQENLVKVTNSRDRGVKYRDNLYVLKHTTAPAVLVETGFISNDSECENLFNDTYQNIISKAIADGIVKALKESGVK